LLKNDLVRLRHVLDAAREAMAFTRGNSRADLDSDRKPCLSLVRLLEIIGEAARGVSSVCQEAHPGIPWSKMIGMRDRLIHGYFDVNLDVVWNTVSQDLPSLVANLENVLSEGNAPRGCNRPPRGDS
jgi:uncharacterized protein with HEPN domain